MDSALKAEQNDVLRYKVTTVHTYKKNIEKSKNIKISIFKTMSYGLAIWAGYSEIAYLFYISQNWMGSFFSESA